MTKEIRNLVIVGALVLVAGIIGAYLYRQSAATPVVVSNNSNGRSTPTAEALVRPDSPTLGPADAKVTVVEFLDPECESCAAFAPAVKRVMADFENARLVIRYMPFHKNSRLAASYIEAAGEQGKYWEMMDKMFARQSEWGEIHGAGPQPARTAPQVLFDKWAAELGLDVEQLKASAADRKHLDKVERDLADGRSLGVKGTPTFFVNGRRLMQLGESGLRTMINDEMKK
ncbi:hypothetical protein BH24ACI3_BH24ACI3_01540 [soil metagenome]